MQEIIQQELEKEFKIEDKGSYENKLPFYTLLNYSTLNNKKDLIYEFPIEISKKALKVIKLPFKLGEVIINTGKEIIR